MQLERREKCAPFDFKCYLRVKAEELKKANRRVLDEDPASIQKTERKEAVPSLVNLDDMPNLKQLAQEVERKHQYRHDLK